MEYDYGVLEYSRVLVEYDTNTSGDKVVYLPLCVQLSAPLTGSKLHTRVWIAGHDSLPVAACISLVVRWPRTGRLYPIRIVFLHLDESKSGFI